MTTINYTQAEADELFGEAIPLRDVSDTTLAKLFDLDIEPGDWQADALCSQTDPEQFFPEKGGSTRAAKAVCRECPVRNKCLEMALTNDERFGIWGGLSERDRRKLKNDPHLAPADFLRK